MWDFLSKIVEQKLAKSLVFIGIGLIVLGAIGKIPIPQSLIIIGPTSRVILALIGGLIFLIGILIHIVQDGIVIPGLSIPGIRDFTKKILRPGRGSKSDVTELSEKRKEIIEKLRHIKTIPDFPVVLLGSTYVDLIVDPVSTKNLEKKEWGDISNLKFHLGGSAYWVGHYLWKFFRKKSAIFSAMGKSDDPLTRYFAELIEKESKEWLIDNFEKSDIQPSGVTVHLIQERNIFTTMFTAPGALKNFCFVPRITSSINNILKDGGVLYISGYFKTSLSAGLKDFLQNLPREKVLVCVDHGLLNTGLDSGTAAARLKEVFNLGLVDIYICTFDEITDLYGLRKANHTSINVKSERDFSKYLSPIIGELPLITIIRDLKFDSAQVRVMVNENRDWESYKLPGGFDLPRNLYPSKMRVKRPKKEQDSHEATNARTNCTAIA